jgi:hypothetical protein
LNKNKSQVAPGYVGEEEMGAGDVELAAGLVQLEDGVSSSDAGYQNYGYDEVLSHRQRFGDDGVCNLMQRRFRARIE